MYDNTHTHDVCGSIKMVESVEKKIFETQASLQCGFCGPGVIMSAKALLNKNPDPTRLEVRDALAGNLCRCTGYVKMIDAVMELAENNKSEAA